LACACGNTHQNEPSRVEDRITSSLVEEPGRCRLLGKQPGKRRVGHRVEFGTRFLCRRFVGKQVDRPLDRALHVVDDVARTFAAPVASRSRSVCADERSATTSPVPINAMVTPLGTLSLLPAR
jgi:hypothetical protein